MYKQPRILLSDFHDTFRVLAAGDVCIYEIYTYMNVVNLFNVSEKNDHT